MRSFPWPFVLEIPVRFRDLDAMGHVNNAVYVTYLEQARNECYLALTGRTDVMTGLDFVVARAEVDFLAPVHHGDVLRVAVRAEAVGRTSFTLGYQATRRDGVQALGARTVLVSYDWARSVKKPVPEPVAAVLRAGIAGAVP